MATPAAPTASIGEAWKTARTVRDAIAKELKKIQNGGQGANETARFDKVERLMQNFRLGCVGMILLETRAADEMDVEKTLWITHSDVARVYKGVIENLASADHVVVLKRKVEKLYLSYLRTALLFYKGLLQRICGLYNIKELKRIARLAEVENIQVPDGSQSDAEAKKLEEIATDTCHKILVHLGDLSRYRTDARPNNRYWSGALTYYSLANDLIPESGYGHNQCGVIYLKTGNHLEVVYHFYRALVGEKRHPHALTNLDVQFKRLRLGKTGVASNDAMISWFVKLHANYFKGDPFSGQSELEDEVDTRLAMALKNGSESDLDMDLLKMILINILAYQVSWEKAKSTEWTDAASRSCQFILLQNIRTIHTISRLLLEELVEIVHRRPVESNQKEDAGQFSATFHRVLPLLRVYMVWLCFNSANVVEYQDHLEPRFGQMCKTLAHVLNLLFELLTSDISHIKKQVPWRLPEDEETLGMECLNGPGLPVGCQLCLDPISLEPKPRAEDFKEVTYTADQISYTRTLNVISCAVSLANQSPFPIVLSKILEGPKESSRFVYTEGGRLNPPFQPDQPPSFDSGSASSALVAVPDVVEQQHLQHETALIQATIDDSDEFSEDQDFYGAPGPNSASPKDFTSPNGSTSRYKTATPRPEFPVEYQLFNIISDLLAPPETGPAAKVPEAQAVTPKQNGQNEELVPAAKTFGSPLQTSPNLGSAALKPIPTLPWNYFYTPTPAEGAARSASGNSPGWEQVYGQVGSRPSTASNVTPVLALEGKNSTLALRNSGQARNSGELSPMLPGHRTTTSELVGMGSPTGVDFTDNFSNIPKGYGYGARDAWTGARINAASNTSPANPWGAPAGRWELGQHSPVGQAVPQSSFSSLSFSGVDSSLPPVNSPWGVSMRAPQAALRTEQSPSWRDHVRSPSGLVNGSSSMALAQSNMERNSTPGLPSPVGGAYDSMASYAPGSNYPAGLPATGASYAPHSDEYQRQQASMNAWINDFQPKMTPPPGLVSPATGLCAVVRQGQAGRAGGGDLLMSAAIQRPRQPPGFPIPSIREPFGPGANGRGNFTSIPKR